MTVQELKNKYLTIEKIKRGGQKIVYKATTTSNDIVALKIISDASDSRILQEIEILKNISLSNLPNILEAGIVTDESINEDALYIIEEFIDGISLRDWINNGNKFNLKKAYEVLYTLLAVEIELEKNNILHRDINPNNIILATSGITYLIDFGLAKKIGVPSLTKTTATHGPYTPGYAPYEQFANMKLEQDVRTDLFQMGITIYESCNGKNPFVKPNETPFQIMSRTMSLVPPLLVFQGDTDGLFSQFINMLMAKNQSQRPDTATDAMRYLNAIKPTLILEAENR